MRQLLLLTVSLVGVLCQIDRVCAFQDGEKRGTNNARKTVQRTKYLDVPGPKEIARITPGGPRPRGLNSESAFALKPKPHKVLGSGYVILTDHDQKEFLDSVQRLAKYRKARVLKVADLSKLVKDPKAISELKASLQKDLPKYVAVVPKIENFRENTLLGLWELFATLDEDPQMDVLPGFLFAKDKAGFKKLIDQTIDFQSISKAKLRPFLISQVPSNKELRSLQKSGILRKLYGEETPTLAVYTKRADKAPMLKGENFWGWDSQKRGDFLKAIPAGATKHYSQANFLVLHGHGIPGMACGVDNLALEGAKSMKIMLCGSCFSAVPGKSDFPKMSRAPGGYSVKQKDSFLMKSVDSGAIVAFGHMRLNSGFPHLYPVIESFNEGKTVGEAYQGLMNGLIDQFRFRKGQFLYDAKKGAGGRRQPKQNRLLYVMIGDPALVPLNIKNKN